MAKYVTCCKDCKNRFVGCHSVCEIYQEQVDEYNKDKKAYNDSLQSELDYVSYIQNSKRQRRIRYNEKRRRKG